MENLLANTATFFVSLFLLPRGAVISTTVDLTTSVSITTDRMASHALFAASKVPFHNPQNLSILAVCVYQSAATLSEITLLCCTPFAAPTQHAHLHHRSVGCSGPASRERTAFQHPTMCCRFSSLASGNNDFLSTSRQFPLSSLPPNDVF